MQLLSNKTNIIPLPKRTEYSYTEIILFSLNFSFKKLRRRKILFSLQYVNDFLVKVPNAILGRTFKRRFILYGPNELIFRVLRDLLYLRQPNIHTGKGMRLHRAIYHVKPRRKKKVKKFKLNIMLNLEEKKKVKKFKLNIMLNLEEKKKS